MAASQRNTILVYPSRAFTVKDGVAEGDAISFMEELVFDGKGA